MKWPASLSTVLVAVLLGQGAQAQDLPTVIAQYYRCNQSTEDMADRIVADAYADVYDAKVEAGAISAWGWNQHLAGGAWRRILYFMAADRDAAFEAWGQLVEEVDPLAANRLLDLCPSHDDYIWSGVAASQATPDPENRSSVSTYLVCDVSREERADEIVNESFAAVWNQHVEAGDVAGWSWYAHDIGGRVRRLLVFTGADPVSVMNGRDATFESLQSGHGDELEEFGSICSGHVDYVWNNLLPESDG